MLITKKTFTASTETIELQTPAYFKKGVILFAVIGEDDVIKVHKWGISNFGDTDLQEALSGEPTTETEFVAAYTLARVKTTFSLSEPINTNNGSSAY